MTATRLPTLGPLLGAAGSTARRFPAVLIAATVSAVAAICMLEELGPSWMQDRLLASATLGLPLFTAATLAAERDEGLVARLLWFGGTTAALAGVFAVWPSLTDEQQFLRYAQLSIAGHLAVAFMPVPRGLPNAFWQYNRTLFERFVIAGITSGVTYVGLALALAALDKLFGVDVPEEAYARLWFVMAFVVNTWLFLASVPRDYEALEARRDYPLVLRVFAQFTLLPLVSLYLVILTLYLAKVLVTWDWPSGWIGWLVSGVATTGIFTLLLVHPAAAEQKWVRVFARDFWIAIVPSIIMLWLAIKQRTDQYGMTEPRYFLLLMSVWLFGLAVFYVATRSQNIRIIPSSLCLVALVTFAGPLSAYAAAERSQFGRLTRLLEQARVVEGSRLLPGSHQPADSVHTEIKATIRFLVQRNATERLHVWLPQSDSLAALGGEQEVRAFMVALGVPPDRPDEMIQDFNLLPLRRGVAASVAGYQWIVPIMPGNDSIRADAALHAMLSRDGRAIEVTRADTVLISVPLDSLLARVAPDTVGMRFGSRRYVSRPPEDSLALRAVGPRAGALVRLNDLEGQISPEARFAKRASGYVLVSLRR